MNFIMPFVLARGKCGNTVCYFIIHLWLRYKENIQFKTFYYFKYLRWPSSGDAYCNCECKKLKVLPTQSMSKKSFRAFNTFSHWSNLFDFCTGRICVCSLAFWLLGIFLHLLIVTDMNILHVCLVNGLAVHWHSGVECGYALVEAREVL